MANGLTIATQVDNQTVTATAATDDCGAAGHAQVIKLAISTDGSATLVPADANGLLVNLGTNNDVTVTGTVTVDGSGVTQPVSAASLPLPTGAATSANQTTLIGHVDGIEGLLTTIDADTSTLAAIDYATGADVASLGVVGGGLEATALRVTIASDSTGTLSVDDGGGALTVDGTVAISGTVAVTQSGTWDEVGINDSGNSITVDWNGTPPPIGAGVEATALRVTIATDSTGVLSIDDNGGAITVDGTVTANLAAGTNNIGDVDVLTLPGTAAEAAALPSVFVVVAGDDGTDTQPLQLSAGGDLKVTLDSETVAIASIAAGDNNIGNVDVVTLPNVTLAAGTNTNEVVGDVAHDAAAAGNPVLIAGVAQAHDDTAPPNRVSAESRATRLATDFDGALFVRPHGPQVWSYHLDTSSAQTDATVHAAPGAGLSLYVGTIVFSSGAATAINLFFEEGSTKVLGPYYLEATAGRGMAVQFNPPKKITANTALTLTTSAAIAHSVDVTGFTAQG